MEGKMTNPFKFGTIVDQDHFTDRKAETAQVIELLGSDNHLIVISPRRFGKTSLVLRAARTLDRPLIYLDLMAITDVSDFASQLLRHVLAASKWETLKNTISKFRIAPKIELNPVTGGMDVSFLPTVADDFTPLEDVLGLIEKMSKPKNKPIVIFDEFQQISSLDKNLAGKLRAVMQHHKGINYVFLGSLESMMKEIFQSKKSPFYHFGSLLTLGTIPYADFIEYLDRRFKRVTDQHKAVSQEILSYTVCHPYNTQLLAYYCYSFLEKSSYEDNTLQNVVDEIVGTHSADFERLWNTIRNTDKRILIALASGTALSSIAKPTSTLYSGIGRLLAQGYLFKADVYEFDDPFFREWILQMRGN
jgi:AAA+ ATPase superfamily predicted ATPase